jgi:hypothetical protein
VLGFEPAAWLADAATAAGLPVVARMLDAEAGRHVPAAMRPLHVITSAYTFDHPPDPVTFLEVAARLLDPARGVLLIEVHDLERLVERREWGLFAHKHSGYYTAVSRTARALGAWGVEPGDRVALFLGVRRRLLGRPEARGHRGVGQRDAHHRPTEGHTEGR